MEGGTVLEDVAGAPAGIGEAAAWFDWLPSAAVAAVGAVDGDGDGPGAIESVVPFPTPVLAERGPLIASATTPAACEAPFALPLEGPWPADARFFSAGSAASITRE
jgi:hypothetical protein